MIIDYNYVTSRLATGGAIRSEEDVQILIATGITHIINCRTEFNEIRHLVNFPTITYLWKGIDDDGEAKPVAWFKDCIEFGLAALSQPGNKLYVHCQAGINRGPSAAYAILRALGLSARDAAAIIKRARPEAKIGYSKCADAAIKELKYE